MISVLALSEIEDFAINLNVSDFKDGGMVNSSK